MSQARLCAVHLLMQLYPPGPRGDPVCGVRHVCVLTFGARRGFAVI